MDLERLVKYVFVFGGIWVGSSLFGIHLSMSQQEATNACAKWVGEGFARQTKAVRYCVPQEVQVLGFQNDSGGIFDPGGVKQRWFFL